MGDKKNHDLTKPNADESFLCNTHSSLSSYSPLMVTPPQDFYKPNVVESFLYNTRIIYRFWR